MTIYKDITQVIKPSTPLMKNPNINSGEIETECLFGDKFKILRSKKDYLYGRLLSDNYCGWVKKDDFNKTTNNTHKVVVPRTFIYENPNLKSKVINYIPMGGLIFCEDVCDKWIKIIWNYMNTSLHGFVIKKHVKNIKDTSYNWLEKAKSLIGTPYKWGGKDSLGIDCSALIQLSLQNCNLLCPRNSSDQINLPGDNIENISLIRNGDLVFWNGHVGIYLENKNFLHSNAFTMSTTIENFDTVIKRIEKEYGPIILIKRIKLRCLKLLYL